METILDALGSPVVEGDRIAYAVREADHARLRIGTIVGFGTRENWGRTLPTIKVHPEGVGRAVSIHAETTYYGAKFVRIPADG